MKRLALAILLFASPALACNFSFFDSVPERPSSAEVIHLRFGGSCPSSCVPRFERLSIEGKTIRILLSAPTSTVCLSAPSTWSARVDLDPLPAGTYDIIAPLADTAIGRRTLTIVPEASPFEVLPRIGRGGTALLLRGLPQCADESCKVLVGPFHVPVLSASAEGLVVEAPSHSDGIVSITVETAAGNLVAANAFTYRAQVDPRDYERVLFPLVYAGPGAGGSDWTSQNKIRNAGPVPIVTLPFLVPSAQGLGPNQRTTIATQARDGGTLLLVPRGLEQFLEVSSHIRDLSRSGENRGTELRVVTESDTAESLRILDVPTDARFRPRLRIYDIDGVEEPVTIRVRAESPSFVTRTVTPRRSFVCITTPCEDASFVAVDLAADFANLAGLPATVDVVVEAQGRRLWAFVSVTNNETQQVTTHSPRRVGAQ